MSDVVFFLAKVLVGLAAFFLIMRVGLVMLRGLAQKHEPPEPGLLRRVNLRYRCSVCLAEVKMVQATEELPPPPRHCQEEMDLVAGPYD